MSGKKVQHIVCTNLMYGGGYITRPRRGFLPERDLLRSHFQCNNNGYVVMCQIALFPNEEKGNFPFARKRNARYPLHIYVFKSSKNFT